MPQPVPVLEPRPSLAILGRSERFPVRRAFCIGRNYAAHAREMGFDPDREPPFFFMKTAEAIVPVEAGQVAEIAYPAGTADYHHEAEVVIAIGKGGTNIAEADALSHVFGYAIGLDMTRRDLQAECKKMGRPWEIGKSADQSGPVGPITEGALDMKGRIRLGVDGQTRQDAPLAAMIWSLEEQIAIISRFFELRPGDLIFTGTPEGVAAVTRGQTMDVAADGLEPIRVKVV